MAEEKEEVVDKKAEEKQRKKEEAKQQLHEIVEQMESIEYQEKGENIFEQYLGKVDQKEE